MNNKIKELNGLIEMLNARMKDSSHTDKNKSQSKPISLSAEKQKLIKELAKLKG